MSPSTMHDLLSLRPRSNGMTFALILLGLTACQEAPLREWRPDDHGHAQPRPGEEGRAAPTEDSAPVSPEEAEARATLALWNVTCATCHARDGRGGGPGLPPVAKVPDLTDPAFGSTRSDEQLTAIIRDGKGFMPAFGPQLGVEGVKAMVAHVRKLGAPPAAP
jgi:mono/diheme cytochrome c family protein